MDHRTMIFVDHDGRCLMPLFSLTPDPGRQI